MLPLLHAPPVVPSASVVVPATHTVSVPVIVAGAPGTVFTVTTCVAATVPHEFVTVYDIVAVPGDAPHTTLPPTVATPVDELLHVPPVAASPRVVDEPTHTVAVPTIVPATGSGLTVTS